MKKIFYYIIAVVMIVCLAIVPAVAADEGGESFDGGDVVTEVYETAEETVYETVGETAGETGGASPSPTETEITESETESEDIAAQIMTLHRQPRLTDIPLTVQESSLQDPRARFPKIRSSAVGITITR